MRRPPIAFIVLLATGCIQQANWTWTGDTPGSDVVGDVVTGDGNSEVSPSDVPGVDTDIPAPKDTTDIVKPLDTADTQDACIPDCDGKDCGDDGCGGSCGTCEAGLTCNASGQCVEEDVCDPVANCVGKNCGDDGCGGICGVCGCGEQCESGLCDFIACEGKDCGPDGCGGSCGTCDDGNPCDGIETCENWQCIEATPLDCDDGNPCTDDFCVEMQGCQHSPNDDNQCNDGNPCTTGDYCAGGFCGFTGLDDCDDGNDCTDDSCETDLGCVHVPLTGQSCQSGDGICVGDACCIFVCQGKECGDDGCGGVCGNCGTDQVCAGVICVDKYEASEGPNGVPLSVAGVVPWTMISWADAKTACELAGKRLCSIYEWIQACANGGTYPYGNEFVEGACWYDYNTSFPKSTGAFSDCEGGYQGIFDMSGNVAEWVDLCSAGGLYCHNRGGSYQWGPIQSDYYACGTVRTDPNGGSPYIGFRCCGGATPPQ